ncbi:rhomboid family protein [Gracilibacillus ureilyticus]|uniref:rhomboid family protein n=1 Tax=Gracilibacillus ureilyticus TaxID=531814 RepID=UPI001587A7B8|nr:rhomboid family intramembrane serine protease [Gracilibacillus ureilyticus]
MYIRKQYLQNQFVLNLMKEGFELISTNRSQDEYLLLRNSNSIVDVVHVSLLQHDWKRDMEQHIIQVERKYKEAKPNFLSRKKTQFFHIYIVDYPPVDDWMSVYSANKGISVFMVDESSTWIDINERLQLNQLDTSVPDNLLDLEQSVYTLKQKIILMHTAEMDKRKKLFEQGKPFFTYILLAMNVIMFGLLEFFGGSTSTDTLLTFGAKYNLAIVEGEWWRILTSMFLHIGIPHIVLNMMALYFIGSLVERIYGNLRFILIYFLSGIAGGIASFALNDSIAAGASGAIFGLFGALLFFGTQFPKDFFRTIGWNVIFVVCLNVVFGFTVDQIDNDAHIGGLIGGFAASGIVMFRQYRRKLIQITATVCLVLLLSILGTYGYYNEANHYNESVRLQVIQQLIKEENYDAIIHSASEIIPYAEEWKAELYFYRSFAHIHLKNDPEAIDDLEACLELKPDFEEALFNLAQLYRKNNRNSDALPLIEKALKLNPDNQDIQMLYDLIKQDQV